MRIMQIHFLPVLVCAIISMVLGAIWYGPLFGKTWMRLLKVTPEQMKDPEYCKKMKKQAQPLYFIQFILSLVQIYVLAQYIAFSSSNVSGLVTAILLWLGFIIPTVAGACMWSNDTKKNIWHKFFIQVGFQLILAIIFGLVLTTWR